ncbi:hypothetical protein KI387_017024 [Taxus chinensis]|uniref:Uncharacterized protein n=1 Tax=Taxus chinensis TaxID=29808 RepID=A0AA38LHA1_TAXCH|nr:hypothetical protein KI387_017024 [Taxus chinensis]
MPMQVQVGVLEKHHSQFVTELTSPHDQVEGGFHISSLIDQNQDIQNLEVACVECSGNKINCFNGAEDEISDKVRLEGQVPKMLEILHAKSRLGSAEVDDLKALPADFPDIPDENMESQDSDIKFYVECCPNKEKTEKHQVPVTKEVLHPKSGEEEASLADLISVPILLQMQKIFSEKEEIFSGESIMVRKTNFNVDDLDESLEFEEEESKQPHGHSAGDQEDTEDLEEKSKDAYISSDFPAKYEVSEKEQIVAGESMTIGSTVFMDNNLDKLDVKLDNLPQLDKAFLLADEADKIKTS